ncbi:MAG: hypothetical protein ACKOOL_05510 [Novosphingobium sp.]
MFRTAAGLAATLAVLTAAQAQAATAPGKPCMTRPELRGMVAYMLPSTMTAVIDKCRPALPAGAAMLARGTVVVNELKAGQSAAFPMARQAFTKFSGAEDKAGVEMFLAMPEETLKPLLEGFVTQKIVSDIKPEYCPDIERVFATLQPLPAANYVDFITEVFSIAARDDKSIPVCAS